jgi:GNAT superfamily N-acetyltransferase
MPIIVEAGAVGSLARLEPLARRIFGEGDRPEGWFARKLDRECVDPSLSRLAIRDGGDLDDPGAWLGYALVGRPPSLPGTARTAGIGLVPSARGRGLGRRLCEAVQGAARSHGLHRLHVPAEAALAPFYARLGFREHRRVQTLLQFGSGPSTDLGAPAAWDDHGGGVVVSAWLREAWERTPAAMRGTARLRGSTFHVAREGMALACHRCVVDPALSTEDAAATVDELRNLVRDGTPLIVVHGDAVSSVTAALRARGWVAVQHGVAMQIDLDRVDKREADDDDRLASSRRLG